MAVKQTNESHDRVYEIGQWFARNPQVMTRVLGVLACLPIVISVIKGTIVVYERHGFWWSAACFALGSFFGYLIAVLVFHLSVYIARFLTKLLVGIFHNIYTLIATLLAIILLFVFL